jgi:predicted RNase H-like HicB family nuclease
MAKYVYPAVFTEEENGMYSVIFPDLEGCYSQGDNLEEAIVNANDVLCFTLFDLENEGANIPAPSSIRDIKCTESEFTSLVACDTIEYRRLNDNKAIKKTLTIPNWLNTLAERSNVNFSQVLQEALTEKLGLKN